jgi:hypothetical protein
MVANAKPPEQATKTETPAKDEQPNVFSRAIDGAAIGMTGGPFGLILAELRPDPPSPSDSQPKKWLGIFPADKDDDDGKDRPVPAKTPVVASNDKDSPDKGRNA